jgi:filamentous hemagglutinin family protein
MALKLGVCLWAGVWVGLMAIGAQAQIVPDDTLGGERSQVRPETIRGVASDRIEGGARRGGNLFHSFTQLDVEKGRGVYFANPEGVSNILSRVTGGDRSEIFGTLGVLGSANLFLINPNGILFGSSASLDIQGSFTASTANGVWLGDQGVFSATSPELSNLLEVSPSALFLNQAVAQGGAITSTANLTAGQDLILSGLNLDLQGQLRAGRNLTLYGADSVQIRDSSLNPFIAASGEQLLVQGDRTVDIFVLNHPNSGLLSGGDMVLRSATQVGGDAHYWSGGDFRIERLDKSLGGLYSPYDPIIRVLGDLELESYVGSSLHILAGGSVRIPGFIEIQGSDTTGAALIEEVALSNGSRILINGVTHPTVDIRAGVSPDSTTLPLGLIGSGAFVANVFNAATSADISIGTIYFNPVDLNNSSGGLVLLTNQYRPNSNLSGDIQVANTLDGILSNVAIETGIYDNANGGGGLVAIDSRGSITVRGAITTNSTVNSAGDIAILGEDDITIFLGGVFADGLLGGNVTIKSGDQLNLSGNFSSNSDSPIENSQGGDININAQNIFAPEGLSIATNTFGRANAGNINIQARGDIQLTGSSLYGDSNIQSNVGRGANANGGNINVTASSLSLNNGVQLQSTVRGASETEPAGNGEAGNIVLNINGNITLSGQNNGLSSAITTQLGNEQSTGATGSGGNINISAGSLNLNERTGLSSATYGNGIAGSIFLNVRNAIEIDGGIIQSSVQQDAVGEGGDIYIQSESFSLKNGGGVNASTNASGNAGQIEIHVEDDIYLGSFDRSGQASYVVTSALPGALGSSGDINFSGENITIDNGAFVSSTTDGIGNAGSITLRANERVLIDGVGKNQISSFVATSTLPGALGNSGDIDFSGENITIDNGAFVSSSTGGIGNAGSITLRANERVLIDGVGESQVPSSILSGVSPEARGNGGNVRVFADSLDVNGGALLTVNTGGIGRSGDISIQVDDRVSFDGRGIDGRASSASSEVDAGGQGRGGTITVQAQQILVSNGAKLTANTSGVGNAGNIVIYDSNFLNLDLGTISSTVNPGAVGNGGSINLQTNRLSLDSSNITASTEGRGNAGSVAIRDANVVNLDRSTISSTVNLGAVGDGGSINLQTNRLSLDSSNITASTEGRGNAGSVAIRDANVVNLDRSTISSTVNLGAVGDGGSINLQTNRLNLDGSNITASTEGRGNAGSVAIRDANVVNLDRSTISSTVNPGAVGNGGSINLQTNRLNLDRSNITASTSGQGSAGDIRIRDAETVSLVGRSTISTAVTPIGIGRGGDITIQSDSLHLGNRSEITASAAGQGRAGDIRVNGANDITLANRSNISATTQGNGRRAGDITINSDTLNLTSGGRLRTNTNNDRRAGNIILTDSENVTINGRASGIFADTSPTSGGRGGRVEITTDNLTLERRGAIAAQSLGAGRAGRVTIAADNVTLNQAQISARSSQNQPAGNIRLNVDDNFSAIDSRIITSAQRSSGGNITLNAGQVNLNRSGISTSVETGGGNGGNINIASENSVILDNNSDIQTRVANGQGNGGNIRVGADAILAFADSDILTTAEAGRGGDITLGSAAFFGDNYQPDAPQSGDRVNVDASGEVDDGTITTPDTNFIQNSLADIPEAPLDTDRLLANSCLNRTQQTGRFTVTGTDGLPQRPGNATQSDYPTGTVQSIPEPESRGDSQRDGRADRPWQMGDAIVEPQGVHRLPDGRLIMGRECAATD